MCIMLTSTSSQVDLVRAVVKFAKEHLARKYKSKDAAARLINQHRVEEKAGKLQALRESVLLCRTDRPTHAK